MNLDLARHHTIIDSSDGAQLEDWSIEMSMKASTCERRRGGRSQKAHSKSLDCFTHCTSTSTSTTSTHHLARTDRSFHASEIGLASHHWSRLKKPWQVHPRCFLPPFLPSLLIFYLYLLSLTIIHILYSYPTISAISSISSNPKVRAGAPFGTPERLCPRSLKWLTMDPASASRREMKHRLRSCENCRLSKIKCMPHDKSDEKCQR